MGRVERAKEFAHRAFEVLSLRQVVANTPFSAHEFCRRDVLEGHPIGNDRRNEPAASARDALADAAGWYHHRVVHFRPAA